jgi:hypothetical protein
MSVVKPPAARQPSITTNDEDYYEGPKTFFLATRRVSGDPIAAMESEPTSARDLIQVGNMMVVAGAEGDIFTVDTTTIISDDTSKAATGTLEVGATWTVRALRVEEARSGSAICSGLPAWADTGTLCFDSAEGGVAISYDPGVSSGATGSEWLALGAMPTGIPVDLEVLVDDEVSDEMTFAELCEAYGDPLDLSGETPADGLYTCTPTIPEGYRGERRHRPELVARHRGRWHGERHRDQRPAQ